ncbi:hypothetical protein CHS0354_025785 [Potamilus streckersoni]|uniref:Uncharacterized protein n=1 Tax=Potamilus streckersoni TaxID=2493646 RepID=A0AAE0WBJ4_9BIVA|nr:hypothetical protein CHS0354_025785 [Potamilus streckersoni]
MDLWFTPLPRESKAIDAARMRNKTRDKLLKREVDQLENKLRASQNKIILQKIEVKDFHKTIDPDAKKSVVYPLGLTDEERQRYQMLRRTSVPTMTLEEFDQKMAEKRRKEIFNRSDSDTTLILQKNRANDVVVVNESKTPTYKQKTIFRDTLKRFTPNGDVHIKYKLKEGKSRQRLGSYPNASTMTANGVDNETPFTDGFRQGRRSTVAEIKYNPSFYNEDNKKQKGNVAYNKQDSQKFNILLRDSMEGIINLLEEDTEEESN